jgi:hypothetical protein
VIYPTQPAGEELRVAAREEHRAAGEKSSGLPPETKPGPPVEKSSGVPPEKNSRPPAETRPGVAGADEARDRRRRRSPGRRRGRRWTSAEAARAADDRGTAQQSPAVRFTLPLQELESTVVPKEMVCYVTYRIGRAPLNRFCKQPRYAGPPPPDLELPPHRREAKKRSYHNANQAGLPSSQRIARVQHDGRTAGIKPAVTVTLIAAYRAFGRRGIKRYTSSSSAWRKRLPGRAGYRH